MLYSLPQSGYYMPKVDVVRRNYHVVTPPLTDLTFAGTTIKQECLGYTSYKLEKNEAPVLLEIRKHSYHVVSTFCLLMVTIEDC